MKTDPYRGIGGLYIEDEHGKRVPAQQPGATELLKPAQPAPTRKKKTITPQGKPTRKGEN